MLTDGLGSVIATFSTTQGSAAMLGTQLYGPYGTLRYLAGSMGTTKGFTGQYGDSLSGLDYYHARYYDPVVGLFLSADKVQGNPQGLDSYSYVGDNPETHTDPTGQIVLGNPGDNQGEEFGHVTSDGGIVASTYPNVSVHNGAIWYRYTGREVRTVPIYDWRTDSASSPEAKFAHVTGWDTLSATLNDPHASWQKKVGALGSFLGTNANNLFQLCMLVCGGGEAEGVVAGWRGLLMAMRGW